jgi:hypothetical protein
MGRDEIDIMKSYRFHLLLAVAATAILGGCGGSALPIIPVSGKVTHGGGAWPAAGTIVLSPLSVAEGHPRRPAIGNFKEDGTFKMTSFKPGDGVIPGTYSVKVTCYEKQPDANNPITFETYNVVPKDFKAKDIVVDPSESSVTVEFDVPKKK